MKLTCILHKFPLLVSQNSHFASKYGALTTRFEGHVTVVSRGHGLDSIPKGRSLRCGMKSELYGYTRKFSNFHGLAVHYSIISIVLLSSGAWGHVECIIPHI